ncbi:MAG: galactokinase [Spirochaetes bacterium GWF1_51_8]|nr:MAG: galactokinase [Spirochaetes bacterium GWF1_51_8]
MIEPSKLTSEFIERYGGTSTDIRSFFAPGRVNLIGEHIDYSGGKVLPAALTYGITAAVRVTRARSTRMASFDHPGDFAVNLESPIEFDESLRWANYPAGVMRLLADNGVIMRSCDILFASDLPDGAGLSSSAALEVLTAVVMLGLSGDSRFSPRDIALLCQRAENQFIGVNCGIMDQYAVVFGKKGRAILLDTAKVESGYVPFELDGYTLAIMNSNKRRGLADSKYNERRRECDAALELIRKIKPIGNLTSAALDEAESMIDDPVLLKRARHAITENARVRQAVMCLEQGDLAEFGRLLDSSHASLRDDYEVTGRELDLLTDAARNADGCIGARMTGAGFGGCAIALVETSKLRGFSEKVAREYKNACGLPVDFYLSEAGDGARELI